MNTTMKTETGYVQPSSLQFVVRFLIAINNFSLSLLELRARLPDRLFKASWTQATLVLVRDLAMVATLVSMAYRGECFLASSALEPAQKSILRGMLWMT